MSKPPTGSPPTVGQPLPGNITTDIVILEQGIPGYGGIGIALPLVIIGAIKQRRKERELAHQAEISLVNNLLRRGK